MKCFKLFPVFILLICSLFNHTKSNTIEYQKAMNYLQNRGEVYFTFGVNSRNDLSKLNDIISIDKIEGHDIFAYANKETFAKFIEFNFNYEILTPPSLVGPEPEMSDYSDPNQEWNKYPTYQGFLDQLDKFQKNHPDKVKIHHLGNSIKNKKIMAIQVSANVEKRENEPKFLHTSTVHGDETTGYVFLLHMVDYLLKNYRRDARATKLIDSAEIWMAPLLNPDGTYARGDNSVSGATRGNSKGVDMNRDYQYPGGGKNPQPESKVLIDFQNQHRFVMSIDFHGGVECFLTPWAYKKSWPQDKDWFSKMCTEYVDDVHAVNSNTFNDKSGCGSMVLYVAKGVRPDHQLFKNQCRSVTVEISSSKTVAESKLLDYWKWHKDAVLNYYMEMFNGIRGTVKTSKNGTTLIGVPAKISLKSTDGNWKDDEYSHVFADTLHGNFYRPVHPGTFDVTVSHPGYDDVIVKDVVVKNGEGTHIDVIIGNNTNIKNNKTDMVLPFLILPQKNSVKIKFKRVINNPEMKATIFHANGSKIKSFSTQQFLGKRSIVWNGKSDNGTNVSNGCYIIQFITPKGEFTQPFTITN